MKLNFQKYEVHAVIKELAAQLNKASVTDCQEEILKLNNTYGEGKVCGFEFSDGLGIILFNCTFKEDMTFNFKSIGAPPLIFKFSIEGKILHQFNKGNIRYTLNPLEGAMTASPAGSIQKMVIPGKQKTVFACLLINRSIYYEKIECLIDEMPEKLAAIFEDVEAKKSFFYRGNYSVHASSCIKKMLEDEQEGLVRSTFIEAKVLELLSRQVSQFKDDLLSPGKQVMLRDYDIEKINNARDILVSDLKNPPIIKELAKQAGLNQQKLKSGFKRIFDSTINNYLRNKRMEVAIRHLLQGASVKEAALEVGYANQSHFARRFKEKYGVLPKEYLKSIRVKPDSLN